MGRLSAFLLALALAAALTVGLSACGSSDDLLPGTTASQINSNLDEVRALVGEGDCAGASEAANTVTDQVAELSGVAKELKEALDEGAARLNEVVAACEEVPSETEEEAAALEAEEDEREAEEDEQQEKSEKEKPGKEKHEKEPEPAAEEAEPPGQEKKEEKEEVPPVEAETGNSGGVGAGAPVEGGE